MCRVLQVSRSGYYDWIARPLSNRKQEDQVYIQEIRRVHIESNENYGTLKIWKTFTTQGIKCGKHRIARLRKEYGIETKRRRRFRITTLSKNTKHVAPNLLRRNFKAVKPNQVWVGDVTYIATKAGWLYLAVLLDLCSRKVVGWAMSNTNDKQLVVSALKMAIEQRQPNRGLLHHTDRGATYGSSEYQDQLIKAYMVASMSRKGDCYDNAVAESFFSTLKNELIYEQTFVNRERARTAIFNFIEIFYNRQRLHQSLNYQTPEMMETILSLN